MAEPIEPKPIEPKPANKSLFDKKDNKTKSRAERNVRDRAKSTSPRSSNWKSIEFSEDHYGKPVVIDSNKMLIASGDMNSNVYKYDLIKQKLKVLFKYPSKLEPFQVSTTINHNKQKIYLYCNYSSSKSNVFMEYDMKSKKLITYSNNLKDTGAFPVLCCLSGNIHLIGGRLNSLHLIWDDIDKIFTERPFRSKMIHGHAVIPLESKKQILVLGGNESHLWGGYLDEIWICNTMPSIQWKYVENTTMPFKMYHFGYIKTKNESHVVIFGGKTKNGFRDDIWILNLQSFIWTKSDIKCPKKGKFYAVKSRDGYVHLFEIDTKHYWKIKLSMFMGTRHNRSGSLSLRSKNNIEAHFKFDLDENDDEKQHNKHKHNKENKKNEDKPNWEHKVNDFHHENQKLKKQLKKSKEKIDALIQQNVKLNQEMRRMQENHQKEIHALKQQLAQQKNANQ